MFLRLLLIFVTVPLLELYLLLRLASITNVSTTIAVVIITGVIGSILAKQQGWAAWWRFRRALLEGRMPSGEIADGLMIVFAAALLLTPGLLTDALGFALLIPAGRVRIRQWFLKRLKLNQNIRVETMAYSLHRDRDGNETIDATFRHHQPDHDRIGDS